MKILNEINCPNDIKKLSLKDLNNLAKEIREEIINVVSKNGGHLSSNLGVVELTIAIHYVFNSPCDKIIWDVGHQSYTHKILTCRKNLFKTLRQFGGISGFPKICESKYDSFGTGHSSTAISSALGFAVARDLNVEHYNIVAVVGDGSMTNGLTFEGLQNAGNLKKNMLIILNDNEMFISQKVGAIVGYFAKLLTFGMARKVEEKIIRMINRVNKFKLLSFGKIIKRIKVIFFPGMLFEEMGFAYIGPIQGHDIKNMITILNNLKDMKGPILLHVVTKKGRGYYQAEINPTKFHSVEKFDIKTGNILIKENITYTKIFSDTLVKLAGIDKKIVAITAAMPEGTGLDKFYNFYPDRYFDVGIAEGHAITFAASLAAGGMKPICAIYSTFIQRAIDNIIHDVALQNLPVVFALDRSGFVGEDGATHHGVFDFSYLKYIPNLIIMSPADGNELCYMVKMAFDLNKPCVIRYPKGKIINIYDNIKNFMVGEANILKDGKDICFLSIGKHVYTCLKAAELLEKKGITSCVVNMRFLKPLDINIVYKILKNIKKFITVEENVLIGGFGEYIKSFLNNSEAIVECIGLPDKFIEHGNLDILSKIYNLTEESIAKKAFEMINK
jgi:1-deoxy-D-xylulose-5-phosphate synthase